MPSLLLKSNHFFTFIQNFKLSIYCDYLLTLDLKLPNSLVMEWCNLHLPLLKEKLIYLNGLNHFQTGINIRLASKLLLWSLVWKVFYFIPSIKVKEWNLNLKNRLVSSYFQFSPKYIHVCFSIFLQHTLVGLRQKDFAMFQAHQPNLYLLLIRQW